MKVKPHRAVLTNTFHRYKKEDWWSQTSDIFTAGRGNREFSHHTLAICWYQTELFSTKTSFHMKQTSKRVLLWNCRSLKMFLWCFPDCWVLFAWTRFPVDSQREKHLRFESKTGSLSRRRSRSEQRPTMEEQPFFLRRGHGETCWKKHWPKTPRALNLFAPQSYGRSGALRNIILAFPFGGEGRVDIINFSNLFTHLFNPIADGIGDLFFIWYPIVGDRSRWKRSQRNGAHLRRASTNCFIRYQLVRQNRLRGNYFVRGSHRIGFVMIWSVVNNE